MTLSDDPFADLVRELTARYGRELAPAVIASAAVQAWAIARADVREVPVGLDEHPTVTVARRHVRRRLDRVVVSRRGVGVAA